MDSGAELIQEWKEGDLVVCLWQSEGIVDGAVKIYQEYTVKKAWRNEKVDKTYFSYRFKVEDLQIIENLLTKILNERGK